jgi:hypothetical protein
VLRFMANVVGVLWHAGRPDPLITAARVPVGHDKVRASRLYPLDAAFGAVVDKEVDGDGALQGKCHVRYRNNLVRQRPGSAKSARSSSICEMTGFGR